ncbi:MAG TPA: SMP-30/gluconolactonase/LRE family protein [Phycisphaerae bacterium]|nr:SMP-30/gluconolactonase/LRE family protein [Phycisphaerae bacterium]
MQIRRLASRRTVLALIGACLISAPVSAHPGSGIAVDRQGQVYFLDTGSGLWKIDTQGKLSKLSGTRFHWLSLDANNRFADTPLPSGSRGDIEKAGTSPTALLSSDYPIATGQDGNLYYPSGSPDGLQIMRMLPSEQRFGHHKGRSLRTSVLASLTATARGPLMHINGIAAGPDNSLYYTEDDAIRRISAMGQVTTVATVSALVGPGAPGSIPGVEQRPYLRGLAVDARGVMYVADSGDARVLKITPDGKFTTLLQLQSPWSPTAVALFGGDVYVLEYLHVAGDDRLAWLPRVRKISADGKSTIIATVEQMPGAR